MLVRSPYCCHVLGHISSWLGQKSCPPDRCSACLYRYGQDSLDRAAGNERQLRTWYGVVQNLPAYQVNPANALEPLFLCFSDLLLSACLRTWHHAVQWAEALASPSACMGTGRMEGGLCSCVLAVRPHCWRLTLVGMAVQPLPSSLAHPLHSAAAFRGHLTLPSSTLSLRMLRTRGTHCCTRRCCSNQVCSIKLPGVMRGPFIAICCSGWDCSELLMQRRPLRVVG